MAHVTIFTWFHRNIFRLQLVKMIVINKIFSLITITYNCIVLTLSQIVYCLIQVVHTHTYTSLAFHHLAYWARIQEGKCLTFKVAKVKATIVGLAINHLIIKSEYWTRVENAILAIIRIHHHCQIDVAPHNRLLHLFPCVWHIIEFHPHAVHQRAGKSNVVSMRQAVLVYRLKWSIIYVKPYCYGVFLYISLSSDSNGSQQP